MWLTFSLNHDEWYQSQSSNILSARTLQHDVGTDKDAKDLSEGDCDTFEIKSHIGRGIT